MSNSKRSDHWDILASVLGAEPEKKESGEPAHQAEEKTPKITENTLTETDVRAYAAQPPDEPAQPPPTRSISNWDALAMELGIEVKLEPPPPPAPIQSPVPKRVEKKVAISAEQPRELSRPAEAEFGKNIETFAPPETSSTEEPQEQSEKKSRHRRRRRRKGRDQDHPVDRMKKQSLDSGTQAPDQDDQTPSQVSLEKSDKTGMEIEEDLKEGESEKQHLKHRHSRRGSRKRKNKGAETAGEKSSDAKKITSAGHAEPVASSELPQAFSGEDEIVDEEYEDRGQRSAKSGFRAIPTWEEAVGCIVVKNMESRPRRQSSGPPRSRSAAESHKRRRK